MSVAPITAMIPQADEKHLNIGENCDQNLTAALILINEYVAQCLNAGSFKVNL